MAPAREPPDTGDASIAGVPLSHAHKMLYPEQGISKLDLARYLENASDLMLPHVSGRPLMLLRVRARLEKYGLVSFVKTTGGKGLHVVVPIRRGPGWEDVKIFSAGIAVELADEQPDRFTTRFSKARRGARIFVDTLRNRRGATWAAPFSPRARPGAGIHPGALVGAYISASAGGIHRPEPPVATGAGPRRRLERHGHNPSVNHGIGSSEPPRPGLGDVLGKGEGYKSATGTGNSADPREPRDHPPSGRHTYRP